MRKLLYFCLGQDATQMCGGAIELAASFLHTTKKESNMSAIERTFAGALVGMVLTTVMAQTASAANVTGGWNVDVDVAGQTGTPVFTFKQDGEKLTGRYKGRFGEADLTGKVKGDEIEFEVEVQGAKLVYTGSIKDNLMEGEVDYDGQASGTWTGRKIDVSGAWTFEVKLGDNTGTPEFAFKQEGETLTGAYKGQFGETDLKGTVVGDQIEFTFDLQGNDIRYKGTIDKDTMKGETDYAGQAEGSWTAMRKESK